MKQFDIKKVMGWLGTVLRCPICQFHYSLKNIQVLETIQDEHGDSARILIHSDCQKCRSSVMFSIDISGPEIYSVGMVSDLTSTDSTKFSKRKPISLDDCIEIHKNLQKFDGDLIKALTL